MTHDLLIRGGLVVDGTGLPGKTADVAIRDGRVTAIGRLAGDAANEVFDADGLVVAPGIVDIHTPLDELTEGLRELTPVGDLDGFVDGAVMGQSDEGRHRRPDPFDGSGAGFDLLDVDPG
jgi:predicted amidohydrolase YtcJ